MFAWHTLSIPRMGYEVKTSVHRNAASALSGGLPSYIKVNPAAAGDLGEHLARHGPRSLELVKPLRGVEALKSLGSG